MFTFFLNFMRRGFAATFSYHSWQVQYHKFKPLCDLVIITIAFFLVVNVFI